MTRFDNTGFFADLGDPKLRNALISAAERLGRVPDEEAALAAMAGRLPERECAQAARLDDRVERGWTADAGPLPRSDFDRALASEQGSGEQPLPAALGEHIAGADGCLRCTIRLLAMLGHPDALSARHLLWAELPGGPTRAEVTATLSNPDLFFRLGLPEPIEDIAKRLGTTPDDLGEELERARQLTGQSQSVLADVEQTQWSLEPRVDIASWRAEHPEPRQPPSHGTYQFLAAAGAADDQPIELLLLPSDAGPPEHYSGPVVELKEIRTDTRNGPRWETRATLLLQGDAEELPTRFHWRLRFEPRDMLAAIERDGDLPDRHAMGALRLTRGEAAWGDLLRRLLPVFDSELPTAAGDLSRSFPGRLPGLPQGYEAEIVATSDEPAIVAPKDRIQRVYFPTNRGLVALSAAFEYSERSGGGRLDRTMRDAWFNLSAASSRSLASFARGRGSVQYEHEEVRRVVPFTSPHCADSHLFGKSFEAACHVAVLLEALRLLRAAAGLTDGPRASRDWVITGAVVGFGVGPVGVLEEKLQQVEAGVRAAELRPNPLLVVPASQVDETLGLVRKQAVQAGKDGRVPVRVDVVGAGDWSDLLHLAVTGHNEAQPWSWLSLATRSPRRSAPRWEELPEEPLAPLGVAFPEALNRYVLDPTRHRLEHQASGRQLLAEAWGRRARGEPLPEEPGEALDEALLRHAAVAWVEREARPSPETLLATDGPSAAPPEEPREPEAAPLRTWLEQPEATSRWKREDWQAFVEAGADALRAGGVPAERAAEIARVVRLSRSRGRPAEPPSNVRSLFGTPTATPAQEEDELSVAAEPVACPMAPPLDWDVASLVRHSDLATTSLSSPLVEAWCETRGLLPGRMFIVGLGRGPTATDVATAVGEAALRLQGHAEVALFAGLAVLGTPEAGETPDELDGIAAFAAGTVAWGGFMQRPADPRGGLMARLEAASARTGLVRLHTQDAATLDRPDDDLDGAAAVTLRPLSGRRRARSVSLPPALLTTPAADRMIDTWAGAVLDRIVDQLDRRVSFFGEQLRDSNQKIEWWGKKSDDDKASHPDVWINQAVDLVALVAYPSEPRAKSATSFYETDIPDLKEKSSELLRKAETARREVLAARRQGMREIGLQLFIDASMRGLDIGDIVAAPDAEVRRAWRSWEDELGGVIRDAGHRWCRAGGLTSQQQARVLNRHVVWRLYTKGDRAVLIPHALIHTQQSRSFQAGRLRAWAHPLDAAEQVAVGPRTAAGPGAAGSPLPTLYEQLWPTPPPWTGRLTDAAQGYALRTPLRACRHVMPTSALEALTALVLEPPPRGSAGGLGPIRHEQTFNEVERVPELAMLLADALTRREREGPESQPKRLPNQPHEELIDGLEALAESWDREWFESFKKLGRRRAPPSAALQAARRAEHLSARQRAAVEVKYSLELVALVGRITRVLAAMGQGQSTLGELYVAIGDLGDRLIADYGPDFGQADAERLLSAAALVKGQG